MTTTEPTATKHWHVQHADQVCADLQTELRAHANPTRMEMIRLAAEDLVKKLRSPCPACGALGFWLVEHIAGLPCGDCGAPTRETRERTNREYADAGLCDDCTRNQEDCRVPVH